MSQGAFLENKRSHPLGLSVVIAMHAAVLAALILAKGELLPPPEPPLIVKQIRDQVPPPPLPKEHKKAKAAAPAEQPIFAVPLPIDLSENRLTTVELPPVDFPLDPPGNSAAAEPAPVKLVSARIDRRFAGDFQPQYPPSAQREGLSGKATVRVRIGPDGRVTAVELVSTDATAFFDATRQQALRRWRFVPATRDGVAVESWQTLTVRFVLNE